MPKLGEIRKGREIGLSARANFIWRACLLCGKERWVEIHGGRNRAKCEICRTCYTNGLRNNQWRGDEVGYQSLHEWIKSHKSKPLLCENCGERQPYDLANISGQYLRDINDYEWLCRRCHMKKDGRINNLRQYKK